MSPKEALGKSTILFPPNNKIIINNNYNGVTEHPILSGEIIKTRYYTHPEHIAETDKYIFTIIAYNSGGTGTFYYLTVIDKKTLTSIEKCNKLIDDRIIIKNIETISNKENTILLEYYTRSRNQTAYDTPNVHIKNYFQVNEGKIKRIYP